VSERFVYDITQYNDETMAKVHKAIQSVTLTATGEVQSKDIVNALQNAGILFREMLEVLG
jgi:hypothetical protein